MAQPCSSFPLLQGCPFQKDRQVINHDLAGNNLHSWAKPKQLHDASKCDSDIMRHGVSTSCVTSEMQGWPPSLLSKFVQKSM
jgi:hypothetical protein